MIQAINKNFGSFYFDIFISRKPPQDMPDSGQI